MRFLLDHNVPDSVGLVLESNGYIVVRVRDIMAADAKDPVVAEAAIQSESILVSWDKDFGHQRFLKPRFASLKRIGFSCPSPQGASRLKEVLDIIIFTAEREKDFPQEIKIGRDKLLIRDHPRN